MGTDDALVAVLPENRHTMPALQTTPARTRDTPETANLKQTLPCDQKVCP